jgi:hypothetical protein
VNIWVSTSVWLNCICFSARLCTCEREREREKRLLFAWTWTAATENGQRKTASTWKLHVLTPVILQPLKIKSLYNYEIA